MVDFIISGLNEGRPIIHLLLHILVPAVVAWVFVVFQESNLDASRRYIWIFFLMMITVVVDVDHLLAKPVYAPDRCSILFHPLHTLWPMMAYGVMLLWPLIMRQVGIPLRKVDKIIGWLGAGLVIHMALDGFDCLWMKAFD